MIGEKQGLKRTRQQVTDIISRRIDYVRDNVASMEKRLRAAENKLNALDSVEQIPGEATTDFPMKEIVEELDEDGEIISSRTMNPGDQAADLLDILKKAGVESIPDVPKSSESTVASEQTLPESTPGIPITNGQEADKQADDLAAALESASLESKEASTTAADQSDAVKPAAEEKEVPIVDIDESPEDAQLRREMLRYGLDEVGAVVAELELDEDGSEISVDDAYDFDDYDDGEEEDEDEDEYGRSTRSVLDEDYHQQMRELEAKLNARGMWNVGKDTTSLPENIQEDLQQAHKVKIERAPDSSSTEPASKTKPKKKVAFANDLDIAPAPKPPAPEIKQAAPKETEIAVLTESIVERTKPVENAPTPNVAPKKTSRFKSARGLAGANADEQSTSSISSSQPPKPLRKAVVAPTPSLPLFPAKPSGPKPFSQPIFDIEEQAPAPASTKSERKILADTLVERDTAQGTVKAPEPDELDEELHRKEIASEFYRMRNRMASQNENSLEEEPEMVPVEEPPKRISKFRASRMR
ncbi:hypothetical protein BJX63DRAFT_201198 [Aspergillus granulosus]|uniref:DUF3835 domain-containing protein n=1 Tax=Aspergillus granulosus TaxID=176169 RepID=A0ABR4HHP0_9EURO